MYYVAYLSNFNVNIVIPVSWVYQSDKQWEKFVNVGLNSNQAHRIFYTQNADAWQNDEPLLGYVADFNLNADEFPSNGCYEGKLLKFFGKFSLFDFIFC